MSMLKKSNMRVLITGANGLLGQKLVYLLHEQNVPFLATSKGACRISLSGTPYQALDVRDPLQIKDCIDQYQPTTIIHTAAFTQVDQCETEKVKCWELNVEAVGHLIEASQERDIHFIHPVSYTHLTLPTKA